MYVCVYMSVKLGKRSRLWEQAHGVCPVPGLGHSLECFSGPARLQCIIHLHIILSYNWAGFHCLGTPYHFILREDSDCFPLGALRIMLLWTAGQKWNVGFGGLFVVLFDCLFVLRRGLATQPTVASCDSLASVFEVAGLQCAPPCLAQCISLHMNIRLQFSATCSPDNLQSLSPVLGVVLTFFIISFDTLKF